LTRDVGEEGGGERGGGKREGTVGVVFSFRQEGKRGEGPRKKERGKKGPC